MKKNIALIGFIDEEKIPGIYKKYNDLCDAFEMRGERIERWFIRFGRGCNTDFLTAFFKSKSDIFWIRYSPFMLSTFLLVLVICALRLQRKKVIIELPAPLSAALKEIGKVSFVRSCAHNILLHLLAPINLSLASEIYWHGEENSFFNFFLRRKPNKLMTNGVDLSKISPITVNPRDKIVMLFVGTIGHWHGVDRVIAGLSAAREVRVDVHIVGDGPELEYLRGYTASLGLEDCVNFHGPLYGSDLEAVYKKSNLGISTLALHRVGLTSLSSIKTREYLAFGLPILLAGDDPDLKDNLPYVHKIAQSDEALDLKEISTWYRNLDHDVSYQCRQFSEDNFSWYRKVLSYC